MTLSRRQHLGVIKLSMVIGTMRQDPLWAESWLSVRCQSHYSRDHACHQHCPMTPTPTIQHIVSVCYDITEDRKIKMQRNPRS